MGSFGKLGLWRGLGAVLNTGAGARVMESSRALVNLLINLDISRKVQASRTVFVPYPHGAPFGVPKDTLGHLMVLRDLFRALQEIDEPGTILEPGYRWRRTKWSSVDPKDFIVPKISGNSGSHRK